MLQQDSEKPQDYVLSMKYGYTIKQLVEMAFGAVDIKIIWEGAGVDEVGKRADNGAVVVRVSPKYFRPAEVEFLLGDSSRAHSELGWTPKYDTQRIITEMVQHDCAASTTNPT